MTFSVPHEKILTLKQEVQAVLHSQHTTPKHLARIAGKLASMQKAIGPLIRFFTRSMYHQIANASSWYQHLQLETDTKEELEFWLHNLTNVNGFSFTPRPTTARMVFTDASGDGDGGFTVERL